MRTKNKSKLSSLIQEIKKEYQHISPIIIAAPTQRCGTTLLQRAINAGGDAIIYGENFFMLEKYPYLIGGGLQNFEEKNNITQSVFDAFEDGKAGLDATALFPDYYEYSKKTIELLYSLMEHYNQYAQENGYKNWGIKHQPNNIKGFINFLNLCPTSQKGASTKMVFIYRDLIDVAASYKARWSDSLCNDSDFKYFAHRWAENIAVIRFYNSPHWDIFVIRYESLINDIGGAIDKLSEYLEINIDKKIFDNKVNAHFVIDDIDEKDIKDRENDGKYIKPAKLTKHQKNILIAETNGLYKKLYDS